MTSMKKGIEKGKVTALTLLDLSAAFDTIDHEILLDRLSEWFGLAGGALKWIVSYLKNWFQSISIQGVISNPIELLFTVPGIPRFSPRSTSQHYVHCPSKFFYIKRLQ